MKIEIKNTDFKQLYEWLEANINSDCPIQYIVYNTLEPQYKKAFLKHKDEKQLFKIGDNVIFGLAKTKGRIIKVYRTANGKYKYFVKYQVVCDYDVETDTEVFSETVRILTAKNIRKI